MACLGPSLYAAVSCVPVSTASVNLSFPVSLLQGAGGAYEALIDVPSKVFDVDFAGQLSQLGAAASLKRIIITRLTPERLPVLARVLGACQQADLQLLMTNAALQLLNERAAADEALAAALKGVQIDVLNRGSEVQLSGGRPLRFIPIPTPRWPDLVAVYSEKGGWQGGQQGSCMLLLAGRQAGRRMYGPLAHIPADACMPLQTRSCSAATSSPRTAPPPRPSCWPTAAPAAAARQTRAALRPLGRTGATTLIACWPLCPAKSQVR